MLGTTMAGRILLNPTQVEGGSVLGSSQAWPISIGIERGIFLWQHRDGYLAVWCMDGATLVGGVYLNTSPGDPRTPGAVGRSRVVRAAVQRRRLGNQHAQQRPRRKGCTDWSLC